MIDSDLIAKTLARKNSKWEAIWDFIKAGYDEKQLDSLKEARNALKEAYSMCFNKTLSKIESDNDIWVVHAYYSAISHYINMLIECMAFKNGEKQDIVTRLNAAATAVPADIGKITLITKELSTYENSNAEFMNKFRYLNKVIDDTTFFKKMINEYYCEYNYKDPDGDTSTHKEYDEDYNAVLEEELIAETQAATGLEEVDVGVKEIRDVYKLPRGAVLSPEVRKEDCTHLIHIDRMTFDTERGCYRLEYKDYDLNVQCTTLYFLRMISGDVNKHTYSAMKSLGKLINGNEAIPELSSVKDINCRAQMTITYKPVYSPVKCSDGTHVKDKDGHAMYEERTKKYSYITQFIPITDATAKTEEGESDGDQ